MLPNVPHEQPQGPANLPAMPAVPPVMSAAATPVEPPAAAATPGQPPMDVILQAEQVVARYGQNPHELAEAFGQLKAGYLLHQYHITSNPAGN